MNSSAALQKRILSEVQIQLPIFQVKIPNKLKQSTNAIVKKHVDAVINHKQLFYTSIQIPSQNLFSQRVSVLQSSKKRAKTRMNTLSAKNKINFHIIRTPNSRAQKIKTQINQTIGNNIRRTPIMQQHSLNNSLLNPEETLKCKQLDAQKLKLRKIQYLLYKDLYALQSKLQHSKSKNKSGDLRSKKKHDQRQNITHQLSKKLPILRNKKCFVQKRKPQQIKENFSKRIEKALQQSLTPWKLEQQN